MTFQFHCIRRKQKMHDRLYGDEVIVDDVNQSSKSTRNSSNVKA